MNYFNLLISLVFALLLTCCSSEDRNNKLVFGISPDNPPYEFLSNGEIQGFDVDLASLIAAKAGKKLEIKNIDFNGLIPALNSGKVDMIISAISVTEERKKHVDFSIPYFTSHISLLINKSSNIRSVADLDNKSIGAQLGSTWENTAQKLAQQAKNVTLTTMNNNMLLVEALKNNRIDSLVMEKAQTDRFIQEYPELSAIAIDSENAEFAIVFAKNSNFVENINDIISQLASEGKINELEQKWFSK